MRLNWKKFREGTGTTGYYKDWDENLMDVVKKATGSNFADVTCYRCREEFCIHFRRDAKEGKNRPGKIKIIRIEFPENGEMYVELPKPLDYVEMMIATDKILNFIDVMTKNGYIIYT